MNNVRIYLSTALIDNTAQPVSHLNQNKNLTLNKRLAEYDECFKIIDKFNYKFEIVETVVNESPFLEKYSKVTYTKVNSDQYKNRGTNYVNAFRKLLESSEFKDDDLIVHITGRYPLVDDTFLKKCTVLDENKIGIFKADNHQQLHLFLYALRYKNLYELLTSLNLSRLEDSFENLESIFYKELPLDKIELVEYLGIRGRQSNSPDSEYDKFIY